MKLMKLAVLSLFVAVIGFFAWIAFTDVTIEQGTKTEIISSERFLDNA